MLSEFNTIDSLIKHLDAELTGVKKILGPYQSRAPEEMKRPIRVYSAGGGTLFGETSALQLSLAAKAMQRRIDTLKSLKRGATPSGDDMAHLLAHKLIADSPAIQAFKVDEQPGDSPPSKQEFSQPLATPASP